LGIAGTGYVFNGVGSLSNDIGASLAPMSASASASFANPVPSTQPGNGPSLDAPLLGYTQKQYKKYVANIAKFGDQKVVRTLSRLRKFKDATPSDSVKDRKRSDRFRALAIEAASRGLI